MRSSLTFHNSLIIATAYFSFLAWFYFRSRLRRGFRFTFSFFRVSRNIFQVSSAFSLFHISLNSILPMIKKNEQLLYFYLFCYENNFPTLFSLAHFTFSLFLWSGFHYFSAFHGTQTRCGLALNIPICHFSALLDFTPPWIMIWGGREIKIDHSRRDCTDLPFRCVLRQLFLIFSRIFTILTFYTKKRVNIESKIAQWKTNKKNSLRFKLFKLLLSPEN